MAIDWRSGVPAHEQIAKDLGARIAQRDFDTGARLPSRDELAAIFDVSTATVSKAIAVLTEALVVIYRPGRGVVVEADGPDRAASMVGATRSHIVEQQPPSLGRGLSLGHSH